MEFYKNKTSKYYGVSYVKDKCKWRAFYKRIVIGYYDDEDYAARMRDLYINENNIKGVYYNFYDLEPTVWNKDYKAFHNDEDDLVKQLIFIYYLDKIFKVDHI